MLSPLLSTIGGRGGVQILSNIYVPMHGLLPCCFLAVCLENRGPISACQVAEGNFYQLLHMPFALSKDDKAQY